MSAWAEHQLDRADVHSVAQEPAGAFVTEVVPVQVDLPQLGAIDAGTGFRARDVVAVAAGSLESVVESVLRVKEAQTELSAVMTLDVLYFGPRTKEAVAGLQKALEAAQPWWHVEEAHIQGLLNALASELLFELQ